MSGAGGRGAEWPLVGRTEELDLLRALRTSVPAQSAVISGAAGVGKSRLANEALHQGAREGWATLAIRGTSGYSVVPFGPLRTVLQVRGTGEAGELTALIEQELLDMRTPKGLLVLADDAQNLDDASTALLHQLTANGNLVLIVTTRTGTQLPLAVTDLWKDRLAERIELQSLSPREATELLTSSLGGHVQDSSARRILRVTQGNPLYLREVVHASLETGSLRLVDGEWHWNRDWASGTRLQEIVAARLGRLSPDETTVMELLATAGALPLELVTRLSTSRAVDDLERRGLVMSSQNGRRLEMSIAHPLHAEVLRGTMPALQQRAVRRNLVDATRATPCRRSEDQVRIACWSIESGLDVDPVTLQLGADAALFGIASAIAARLDEVLPNGSRTSGRFPAIRQDLEVAIRLAQAAYDRTGTFADGIALSSALTWVGDASRADAVLAELVTKALDPSDRLRLAIELSWMRFWVRFDVEGATGVMLEAIEAAGPDCDPLVMALAYQEMAAIKLNIAQPAEALLWATESAAILGVDVSSCNAAATAAAATGFLGHCDEAIALVDRAVPIAYERGHPLDVSVLLFGRTSTLARTGRLEEARGMASWLRDVAIGEELAEATAVFGVLLAEIHLRQGRPASAGRIFRDSCGLFAERNVFGYRPWALTGLARARALLGQGEEALAALKEAQSTQPISRLFDMSTYLARVETQILVGNTKEAARSAREGVHWAREAGMVIDEAVGLDACIRVDPQPTDAARLGELAEGTDSGLVAVMAANAAAVVSGDPDDLLDVSVRLADLTAWWAAADAANGAARLFDQRHRQREARAAARKATEYASHCEGYRPSTPGAIVGPTRLTKREGEIARLAADGGSNREIAERMALSLRTVENHLHNAYVKLGVSDRASLATALETLPPEKPPRAV
jgi:DNA-binding NarL/FixJ family response regulator